MTVLPSANSQSLNLETFQDIVDQFGENSAHWPEEQRAGAVALSDTSPAAREVVAEATQLRTLLKRRPVKAPAHLLTAIEERLTSPTESVCSVARVRVRS